MQTNIAIEREKRDKVSQILNTIVADENVLYIKLRNYHWNVRGIHFPALHALFEEQYNELLPIIDEIAERVRMVGFLSLGTMASFLEHTRIEESPSNDMPAEAMIQDLVKSNQAMIRNLRDDIDNIAEEYNDEGTADLLTETIQLHEKFAWMLRAMTE